MYLECFKGTGCGTVGREVYPTPEDPSLKSVIGNAHWDIIFIIGLNFISDYV